MGSLALLSENIVSEDEDIENVGVGLEKISKIKDIQDNINEKYEKDVQRSSTIEETPKETSAVEETPKVGSVIEENLEEVSDLEESSNDEGGE